MIWLTTRARRCGALNRSATSAASSQHSTATEWHCCGKKNGSPDEAIDLLERVRTSVQKHKMFNFAAPTIDAVLEIAAAHKGQPDEAIDVLRASFSLHMASCSRLFVGCPGEALVGLLIEGGSTDDLIEAHRIVDDWKAQRPGIPALELWWLKSRALLAKSEGDFGGYAELAKQYLSLCEKLDVEGGRRSASDGEQVHIDGDDTGVHLARAGPPIANQRIAVRAIPAWSRGPCADTVDWCSDRTTARLRYGRLSIRGSRRSSTTTGRRPILMPH